MKFLRVLAVLAIALMLVSTADAVQVNKTLIATVELNADPVAAQGSTNIGQADKVAFFVVYDETEVGGGVSLAITMQVKYNDTTGWLSASFFDFDGGSTLQTSETLTADGSYYCWFNRDLTVPQVKLILTATGTDVDDTADVTGYIVQDK